jgi:hypothetical protein
MTSLPNAQANTEDFEFQALSEAHNYRAALFREFAPWLKGNVIEIGAGIGQMTAALRDIPAIERIVSIEPSLAFCAVHRSLFPDHHLIEGTFDELEAGQPWNAIFSINVLEHIEDDEGELAKYAAALKMSGGHLCLFVPACPEVYAPIDRDFGHFRRYSRPDLKRKLEKAGFKITRLNYFNCIGFFAWWLNFCVLKKRGFDRSAVRFFDRLIFPPSHWLESTIVRPPFGQSLIAVATAS